jgi:hypothetical protein
MIRTTTSIQHNNKWLNSRLLFWLCISTVDGIHGHHRCWPTKLVLLKPRILYTAGSDSTM